MKTQRAFRRVGGALQFRIHKVDDLAIAARLDTALWVASGAPVDSMIMDQEFLALVDTDRNGRIMTGEVRQAIDWLLGQYQDTRGVEAGSESISLEMLGPDAAEARSALTQITGGTNSGSIGLAEVREMIAVALARNVSNDGVVLQEAGDEKIAGYTEAVKATTGGTPHPSGAVGITVDNAQAFQDRLAAYLGWKAELPEGDLPFGELTAGVYDACQTLMPKIAQYFALCHAESLSLPRSPAADPLPTDLDDTALLEARLRREPLARPRVSAILPMDEAPNPYFRAEINTLAEVADQAPVPFGEGLTEDAWSALIAALAPYDQWIRRRPDSGFAALDEDRLKTYADGSVLARLEKLAVLAAKSTVSIAELRTIERLLLYQANILRLANNFVSFPDLYDPARRAIFEAGTLVIDGRHFTFCVRVADLTTHQRVAAASSMFVVYARIYGPPTTESEQRSNLYTVAAPVTWGTAGNLVVGKRGVFYDLQGIERDAEVVAILVNPVSLKEALWLPFKRLGDAIGSRVDALAADAQARLNASAQMAVSGDAGQTAAAAVPAGSGSAGTAPAASGGRFANSISGLVAGGGLAIAALGSAFAYLTSTLSSIPWWHILVGLGGAVVAVLIPTLASAVRKIRKRDLSAIMEASGWAVNARMRLSRRQSKTFTFRPSVRDVV